MRAFVFIYIVSVAFPAFGEATDYAQRLARAKSASEVRSLERLHEQLQIARRACRLQLQNKIAPVARYESLELEGRWGLHPRKAEQFRLREKLDRLCAEAAQHLRAPRRTPSHISARCREEIEQAQNVMSYRESQPEWSEN
jgi:hypothetical protein